MDIDTERLKTDPDYWNRVAPEGATHYCPDQNAFYQLFQHVHDDRWYVWSLPIHSQQKWISSNGTSDSGRFISRPTKPQSSGPVEDSLPVGTECEGAKKMTDTIQSLPAEQYALLPEKQASVVHWEGKKLTSIDAVRCLAHPDSIEFCNWIADFLEIEADGGNNPGEFVRWGFEELYKRRLLIEERVQRLKRNRAPLW